MRGLVLPAGALTVLATAVALTPTSAEACGAWRLQDHERDRVVSFSGMRARVSAPRGGPARVVLWGSSDTAASEMVFKEMNHQRSDRPEDYPVLIDFDAGSVRLRGQAVASTSGDDVTLGGRRYQIVLRELPPPARGGSPGWSARVLEGDELRLSGRAQFVCPDGERPRSLDEKRAITRQWVVAYLVWRDLVEGAPRAPVGVKGALRPSSTDEPAPPPAPARRDGAPPRPRE